jgi:hypothetical protein
VERLNLEDNQQKASKQSNQRFLDNLNKKALGPYSERNENPKYISKNESERVKKGYRTYCLH